MSQKRDVVLRTLAEQNIPYQLWEHPAVYTIEEMDALDLPAPEAVVKNLFLRDAKGRRYFLVVLSKEKQADLRALGEVAVDPAVQRLMGAGEQPRAPGMKYRHYAPKAPVTVVQGDPAESARYIRRHVGDRDGVICFDEFVPLFEGHPTEAMGPAADQAEQARRVFDALRYFDGTGVEQIWAQGPDPSGIGLAVSNRLNKAAGFHIVQV